MRVSDQPAHPFGMLESQAVADWCAIIHEIHGIFLGAELVHECIDHVCVMGESVSELGVIGCIALTEARIVRRDDVIAIREQRNEIAEHVRGCRESVQKQDDRAIGRTGFTIEHVDAIDLGRPIVHGHRHLLGDRSLLGRSGDSLGKGSKADSCQHQGKDQSVHLSSPF